MLKVMTLPLVEFGNWYSAEFVQTLRQLLTSLAKKVFLTASSLVIKTTTKNLQNVLLFLKEHSLCSYKQLIEIATEDTPKFINRFRSNYILSTVLYAHKIIVTVTTHELVYLPSITRLFASAG